MVDTTLLHKHVEVRGPAALTVGREKKFTRAGRGHLRNPILSNLFDSQAQHLKRLEVCCDPRFAEWYCRPQSE